MSRHLIVLPDDYQPWRGPEDGPHPMEVAREALIEAANWEQDSTWRDILLSVADTLPPRP
jgi:hypothetical protein